MPMDVAVSDCVCPSAPASGLVGQKRASWRAVRAALILGFSWSHFLVRNQKFPGSQGEVGGFFAPLCCLWRCQAAHGLRGRLRAPAQGPPRLLRRGGDGALVAPAAASRPLIVSFRTLCFSLSFVFTLFKKKTADFP